jgi:acyl-coenzyme A synthetase/AMP-(fatty) acid ligase
VLHIKGPGMMNGYHNNPEETARRLKDGWYDSGDVLRRDEEGWYYFISRSDDMFNSSGHNIYPGEVELMLERHPDIEQALVVPIPDDIKYRIPHAFIVLRQGAALSEDEVKRYALDNGPPHQHPRKVYFVPALLMNGVGKIDRKAMLAKALEIVEADRTANA